MKLTDIVFKIHRRGDSAVELMPHDADEASDPKYYGFAHPDGGFMIMEDTGGTAFRYYIGRNAYQAAWAGRAGLSYDYIYNLL